MTADGPPGALRSAEGSLLANDDERLRRYWHPVALASEVTDRPHAVRLLGQDLVVARDGAGGWTALPDRCPHRWARLSDGCVVEGELQCPYHGWRFAPDGRCTLVPALGPGAPVPPRAHLEPYRAQEAHGMVWVALEEPAADLIDIPELGAPGIVAAWLPVTTLRCGAAQFIDNFLDIAHFPFVHAATFGIDEPAGGPGTGDDDGPDHAAMEPYAVETSAQGDSLRVRYDHWIANREDPGVAAGERPLVQPRRMEYVYQVPFTARLRLELPMTGIENTVIVALAPVDATTTVLFSALLRNDLSSGDDAAAAEAVDFELRVLAEDLVVLERFDDPRFPLDPTLQVHTRADRTAVEFRRLLAAHLHGLAADPGAPAGAADGADATRPTTAPGRLAASTAAPGPS